MFTDVFELGEIGSAQIYIICYHNINCPLVNWAPECLANQIWRATTFPVIENIDLLKLRRFMTVDKNNLPEKLFARHAGYFLIYTVIAKKSKAYEQEH